VELPGALPKAQLEDALEVIDPLGLVYQVFLGDILLPCNSVEYVHVVLDVLRDPRGFLGRILCRVVGRFDIVPGEFAESDQGEPVPELGK
jgi:hypothetical protein